MAMRTAQDEIDSIDELSAHPDDRGSPLKGGPGRESFKVAAFWKGQVNAYTQATSRWRKRGNTVIKRFRDERSRMAEEGQRRMNLLWANTKVMMPAIYSQCPIPVVDRKFLDRDPTGRLSSQMLERTLINELESSGFHVGMKRAVLDRLLPGRGVLWARYVPEFGEGESLPGPTKNGIEDELVRIGEETGDASFEDETPEEEKLEETNETVIAEKIEIDYIDWDDFLCFPAKARTWEEVQAVCKRIHISRKEAREFFGKEIGSKLRPDTEPKVMGHNERQTYADSSVFEDINERNIVIYEIWNKSDKRVYWISTGYEYLCKVVDDPLELTTFFPVPPPLMSTSTNDTIIPVPDYLEWQDQAIQIDELTQRIAMLTKACKVAGVYAANNTAIGRIFNESIENELIPVDQWAMFADAGGLKGVIDFIPLDTIQSCIETLLKVRQQAMIDLDQVTGISDVIRGTSDSRETLGGLRLKNNNAGTRLTESQEEIAVFARKLIVIMAEIVCKHFSDETIIESSGILMEDALQPDTVMREFAEQIAKNAPKSPPSPAQGLQAPSGHAPQLPAPHPMAPPAGPSPPMGPQGAPPAAAPPSNNVVPFPGGGHPQPPMGGAMGMPQMQPMAPPMPPPPPDPQALIMMKVDKALQLLRKDVTRGYRIDIETDSTVFGDKMQDRQDAAEFLQALGGYMKQAEGAANLPESLPLFAKALQWGVRRYRVGRDLEAEIDNFADLMAKKAKELIENPPPSPEQQKAQAEIEQMKQEGAMQQANDQRDAERQAQNDMREAQLKAQDDAREQEKAQLEFAIEKDRMNMEREKMQMEMEMAREEHAMKLAELRANLHVKSQEAAIDIHKSNMDIHHREREHELDKKDLAHQEKEQNQKHRHKQIEQNKAHKERMKPKPAKKAS